MYEMLLITLYTQSIFSMLSLHNYNNSNILCPHLPPHPSSSPPPYPRKQPGHNIKGMRLVHVRASAILALEPTPG